MPTQKMKVDIAKLALNLDGCRFGSPPPIKAVQQQQQRQEEDDQRQRASTTTTNGSNHDDNEKKYQLSPLSTHHLNHKAQYNNHQHHSHYYNHNELTSPLGTTYRREGLSIGHNFLRFQGSTLSNNFNSNQLDVLECIGRGVCSAVWKAKRRRKLQPRMSGEGVNGNGPQQQIEHREEEEEYYALKVFSMRDPQKRTMLIRELKLLCSTTTTTTNNNFANDTNSENDESTGQECECLVELQGAFLDELDGTVTLVLEYMNFGSLADLLSSSNHHPLPEYAIASIAYQMIWGLGYLHHEGVLHRDIKPANVLLSTDGRVKLADFGIISNKYNPDNDNDDTTNMNVTMVGTTRYMSPERLRGQPYNKQADIWSLGLILLECTRGGGGGNSRSPFEHIYSIVELVQTLDDCVGGTMGIYIPDGVSLGLREILMGCLTHCAERRMPADVLIGSPWFEEVDDNGRRIECVDDAVVGMKCYLETL